MTTYQLVPYLVTVALRGNPNETRPLDDLFAGGEELAKELAGLLAAHLGHLVEEPDVAAVERRPRRLQVLSVGRDGKQLNAVVAPGKMGLESKLRSLTGEEHDRVFTDTELVPLRHYLTYPTSGHKAILMAERAGGVGAISTLQLLLRQTWAAKHPDTVLHIAPAMAEDAFKGALEKRPIKKLIFRRAKGPNGNLTIGRLDVQYDLKVRPRGRGGRWMMKDFVGSSDGSQVNAGSILKEVVPVVMPRQNPDEAAAQMLEDGWTVAVELDLPGSVSRTVYVDQSTASSLSFAVVDGELEPTTRPEDGKIAEAAKRVVADDLLAHWGIGKAMASGVTWTSEKWTNADGWRVKWDVVADQPSSHSP